MERDIHILKTDNDLRTKINVRYFHTTAELEEILPKLQMFAKHALNNAQQNTYSSLQEKLQTLNAAVNHKLAINTLQDSLAENHPTTLIILEDNGHIIGFSQAIMGTREDARGMGNFYIGIDQDLHKRKGLGSKLAILQGLELVKAGITEFDTRVWEGSERLIQKLNIPYSILQGGASSKYIRISLSSQQLIQTARSFGITFS